MSTEVVHLTLYLAFMAAYEDTLRDLHTGHSTDQALLRLMQSYPSEFTKAFDEHMLYVAEDPRGINIQKRFRTEHVVQDGIGGHIDMCIWHLMCEADIFWQILENIKPRQTLH